MRDLIGEHIKEASLRRTAPMIADSGESQVAFARAPMVSAPVISGQMVSAQMVSGPVGAHADPTPTATVPANVRTRVAAAGANDMHPAVGSNDPMRPLLVRTITFRTAPMQTAAMTPMPALMQVPQQMPQQVAQMTAPVAAPVAPPAPVPIAAPVQQAVQLPVPPPVAAEPPRTVVASADPAQVAAQVVTAPQPARAEVATVAAPVVVPTAQPIPSEPSAPEAASFAAPQPALATAALPPPSAAAIRARGGWMIQIGAFDDEDEAKQHLSDAQVKVHTALAAADPFTEKVQKGDKALYRARFAGFDKTTAETACKELKRSDFQCMALKD
jgi:D-alanyl-D-alanine carboxypeptidase